MASWTVLILLVLTWSATSSLGLHYHLSSAASTEAAEAYLRLLFAQEHDRVVRAIEEDHPHKCCGKDAVVVTEKDKELMKQCSTEIKSQGENGGEEDPVSHTACWMECMAQKKSVADSEGYMKEAEFTQQYMQHFTDPTLKELTEKAIAECIPLCNDKAKELGPAENNGKKCIRAAWLTALCVRIKVETCCPDAEQIKSEGCNKLRTQMEDWKNL